MIKIINITPESHLITKNMMVLMVLGFLFFNSSYTLADTQINWRLSNDDGSFPGNISCTSTGDIEVNLFPECPDGYYLSSISSDEVTCETSLSQFEQTYLVEDLDNCNSNRPQSEIDENAGLAIISESDFCSSHNFGTGWSNGTPVIPSDGFIEDGCRVTGGFDIVPSPRFILLGAAGTGSSCRVDGLNDGEWESVIQSSSNGFCQKILRGRIGVPLTEGETNSFIASSVSECEAADGIVLETKIILGSVLDSDFDSSLESYEGQVFCSGDLDEEEFCVPAKSANGNVSIICL